MLPPVSMTGVQKVRVRWLLLGTEDDGAGKSVLVTLTYRSVSGVTRVQGQGGWALMLKYLLLYRNYGLKGFLNRSDLQQTSAISGFDQYNRTTEWNIIVGHTLNKSIQRKHILH